MIHCDRTGQKFNRQLNRCHLAIRPRGCLNRDRLLIINHAALHVVSTEVKKQTSSSLASMQGPNSGQNYI